MRQELRSFITWLKRCDKAKWRTGSCTSTDRQKLLHLCVQCDWQTLTINLWRERGDRLLSLKLALDADVGQSEDIATGHQQALTFPAIFTQDWESLNRERHTKSVELWSCGADILKCVCVCVHATRKKIKIWGFKVLSWYLLLSYKNKPGGSVLSVWRKAVDFIVELRRPLIVGLICWA